MDLLPALDLRGGKVVRLLRGADGQRTEYALDPRAVIEDLAAASCAWLHLVDLDAAFGEAPQHTLVAELVALARARGLAVELGGGLGSEQAVAGALALGCARVIVGSLAAREPARFAALCRAFPGRVVPAVEAEGEEVRTAGWREGAALSLAALCATLRGLPCPAVLVTDVARDGALCGPSLALARRVGGLTGLPVLASGGVASLADLRALARLPEVAGAVVGRALYEGAFSLAEALVAAARGPSELTRRVIPCLDVAGGRVVKGVRFLDLVDHGDPAEAALRYAGEGADEIVFLDITASAEGRGTALGWVEKVAEKLFVPFTVGGGVRSVEDARALLLAGADKVALNTAAVERPALLTELATTFGAQCVVLAIDARRRAPGEGWEVVTHGGRKPTGRDALAWSREGVEAGAGEILLTSMDGDGTQAGYDLPLIRAVAEAVPVPVIASGGAGAVEHLAEALAAGAAAVLAASIFHQRQTTVGAVKRELALRGLVMREEVG